MGPRKADSRKHAANSSFVATVASNARARTRRLKRHHAPARASHQATVPASQMMPRTLHHLDGDEGCGMIVCEMAILSIDEDATLKDSGLPVLWPGSRPCGAGARRDGSLEA